MPLHELTPMPYTRAMKGSVDFYTNILSFECREFREEWGWASLHRDSVYIMLAIPNEHLPFEKPTFTGSLYLYCDDVDELWEKLKDKARVCYPIDDFFYGMREFATYDKNGYLLQFGQEISTSESKE